MDATGSATAAARAGGRRFRQTVMVFAVLNVAAWVGYHHFFGPQRARLLRVDRFSPGDRATIDPRPTLEWQFNLDVTPDAAGGPPGIIQPAVNGKWEWRGRRNLVFQPQQDLPRATRFTLTLPAERLRTAEGFRLNESFIATVNTPPLRVVGVRQGGFAQDRRFVLEIEFNDAVIPADVAAKLALKGPDDKPLAFTLHGEGVGKIVRVLTDSVPQSPSSAVEPVQISLRLTQGLAGTSGPLGLDAPFEQKLALGTTLAATEVNAVADGRGRPEVFVQFNGPVEHALLREVLSVEPPVPFTITSNYRGIALEGDFRPGSRYAVKIAAPPKGADARIYPRPDVLSVFVPDRSPSAWFEHEAGYLGSQGNRALLAHAVNLPAVRVRVWRVYDGNLVEWRNAGGNSYRWQADPRAYGKPVASRTVKLKTERNLVQDLRIVVDDYLGASADDGVYRVSLSPADGAEFVDDNGRDGSYESASAVVTLSDVALTAKREPHALTVWATSLSTANPLERVRVRAFSSKNQLLGQGLTGADGLVTLSGLLPAEGETIAVLLADCPERSPTTRAATRPTTGTSVPVEAPASYRGLTWMDLRRGGWDLADTDVAGRPYARSGHEAYVYTDRGVYRPGETVHLRAIVRRGDGVPVRPMPVRWLLRRPDLRDWKQETTTCDADGSVGLDLNLPDDLTTGRWTAQIGLPGESTAASTFGSATFLVEEYVPNRLKVGLSFAGKGVSGGEAGKPRRVAVGEEPVRAVVQGDYLFGRPASGLQTKLSARLDPSVFQPAGWAGWTFGDSARTLFDERRAAGVVNASKSGDPQEARALDEKGRGEWPLHLEQLLGLSAATRPATSQPADLRRYRGPWQLAVQATVQEVAGRSVTAADSIQVDVLPWYIGVHRKSDGPAAPGAATTFELALVAPAGKLAAREATLEVSLLREAWNNSLVYRDGRYRYESSRVLEPIEKAPREARILAGRGTATVTPPAGGSYVLRLRDGATGAVTSVSFYASNGSGWDDNVSREHPERLELVVLPPAEQADPAAPPSSNLKVGQTARVLVRSPFAGRMLFTVETDHVISARVIDMTGSSVEVPVEITDALRPNAYVTASVIRPINPQAKWRTHRALGTMRLTVDPADRRLAIEIRTDQEVRPQSTLPLTLRVTDAAGRPVSGAPVTVATVDEGILQLTRFATPDPLGFFHAARALAVESLDVYGQLMPEVPRPDKNSTDGGDRGGATAPRYRSPVTARRVRPVALFAVLRTDADGVATTNLSIPEFSGQLRLMAVAHSTDRFGAADRQVKVRSPLLVQSSLPRFAAPGDRFVAPVTLFNNTKADMQATLTAELLDTGDTGVLAFAASRDRQLTLGAVSIPAGGQHVLGLPLTAGRGVGVAHLRLAATAGSETSTETTELPIRPASPTVSRGGFAIVTPDKGADLVLKEEFLPGTEQASLTLSRMPTLQLPQGIDYLERYPYGCAEQTVSTSFPLIYLDEIGPQIAPGLFEKRRVAEKVQAGILRLLGMQTADGGLAMWPGGRESWPWTSVYAAHFLVEARAAGHPVPEDFEHRLLGYLRALLVKGDDGAELIECQAYAAYVLAISGKPDRPLMNRLGELTKIKTDRTEETAMRAQARLHLALAWLAAGRRDLAEQYLPSSLPLRTKWQSAGNVGSPVRDRAIFLNTLLTVRPDDPTIPAQAAQLAESKWQNTQDAAFAAMAIGKYLRAAKNQVAYDHAELTLAGQSIASGTGTLTWPPPHAITHPTERHFTATITGPPAARAYLTWLRTGVPQTILANEDHGIKLRRRYLDERGKPLTSTRVRSGDLILVELTVQSSSPQRNLAIEDLLPAGLEIENARLQGTALPQVLASDDPRSLHLEELRDARTDVRDDRMIFFGHLPEAGVARQIYAARAVVPGTFVLPPARAESMYDAGTTSLWGPGGTLEVTPPENKTIVGVPTGE